MPRARKRTVFLLALTVLVCAGCGRMGAGVLREAGSDARSRAFQGSWLGRMMIDAGDKFNAESVARDFSRLALDPTRLVLLEPTAVRVYFVAAQGGFLSALGYWTEGARLTQDRPHILFSNATSPLKLFEYADTLRRGTAPEQALYGKPRSKKAPMLPGDFIDLGTLPAGTRLVFFLDSDAVNAAKGRFTTIPGRNPDKMQHVVTVAYQNSPYVLLAFEDLMGGGDRTFNDVVFAVELGQSTIEALGDSGKRAEVDELLDQVAKSRMVRIRLITAGSAGLLVGGPLLFWALRRYLRRRRVALACAAARQSLESGDPREALRRLRAVRDYDGSGTLGGRLADVELAACKQLHDAAALEDLFGRHPAAVLRDETASLMAARAQTETGRTETFHVLRHAWRDSEAAPWEWVVLEADLLAGQENSVNAESLLRQRQFAGPHDAIRLARLAELHLGIMPAEAGTELESALRLAPEHPEVQRSRARTLEWAGRMEEAGEAWRAAVTCSGGDPFHRDHYAEHLVRRCDFAGALVCWRDALVQTPVDTIWLKAIFWERVAGPACMPWDTLERPQGPLRSLLERLLAMPPDRFWDPDTLEHFAQRHPELHARPECLWLRLLQALQDRQEEAALALLSARQPDSRRYFDLLEAALRQTLTYRRMQFLNPGLHIVTPGVPATWCVPLFRRMDQWAHGELAERPLDLAGLLMGGNAFAEVFRAVGWMRAAAALRPEPHDPAFRA